MNRLTLFGLGLGFCWQMISGAGEVCTVRFLNGDQVQGEYLGQEREYALVKTKGQNGVLRIQGKYIEFLDFGRKDHDRELTSQVRFPDDQQVSGEILNFSEGKLQLRTAWADHVSMDRGYVQAVENLSPVPPVIYRGPSRSEKWEYSTVRNNQTRKVTRQIPLDGGAWMLTGEGKLSRSFPLMNAGIRLKISMEVPYLEPRDSLRIILQDLPAMEGANQSRRGSLQIGFNQKGVSVEEIPAFLARARMFVGQRRIERGSIVHSTQGLQTVLFEFDPVNQRYRVQLDDVVVAEWQHPEEGEGIKAYSPRLDFEWDFYSSLKVSLRDIRVTRMELPLPEETIVVPEGAEAVRFQNGDFLKVHWESVDADGGWEFLMKELGTRTSMNPSRIQQWMNESGSLKCIRRISSHVEFKLSGGEDLFLAELLEADEEAFTIQREGWQGPQRIPVSLLETVRFNPYFGE